MWGYFAESWDADLAILTVQLATLLAAAWDWLVGIKIVTVW